MSEMSKDRKKWFFFASKQCLRALETLHSGGLDLSTDKLRLIKCDDARDV